MGSLLETVVPVFSVVLLGWWLAGRSRMDLPTLANLALLVTSPALMFSVLGGAEVDFERWGVLVGGTLWIAKGEGGLFEIIRMPLAYGSIGGLALAISGQTLPRIVMEPIEMLGAMAIPLLLLSLGMHLRTLAVRDIRHTVVIVAIRVAGGAICALLFISLFGVSGVERKVLLLASIMPAAVINVIIAQRYSRDPSLVASAVVLGTLISLVTIPLVLYFAG